MKTSLTHSIYTGLFCIIGLVYFFSAPATAYASEFPTPDCAQFKVNNGWFGSEATAGAGVLEAITNMNGRDQEEINTAIQAALCNPTPRIRIPGLTFTSIEDIAASVTTTAEGNTYLQIPFIGEYLVAIYRYSFIVIAVLAVVLIIVSGIQYMLPGNGNTDEAKKRIGGAVIGLVLLALTYITLYTINPELVQLKSLSLQYISGETIDAEGNPDTTPTGNITVSGSAVLSQNCNLSQLPVFAQENQTFGVEEGYCLRWVKQAVQNMCGEVPSILATQRGAWDAAAVFYQQGNFHTCNLDGIKDGDLVFGVGMGSNWIRLWENFRMGPNGCTIADASLSPMRAVGGRMEKTTPIVGKPKAMPPVTHIGIYYKGYVYHLFEKVENDPTKSLTFRSKQTRANKVQFNGVELTGNFLHNNSFFIAGYGSWGAASASAGTPAPSNEPCVITKAIWDFPGDGTVRALPYGATIGLEAHATGNCTGKKVHFSIFEYDSSLVNGDPIAVPPADIAFDSLNVARVTWVTETQNDGLFSTPEYLFRANIVGDSASVLSSDPAQLEVH